MRTGVVLALSVLLGLAACEGGQEVHLTVEIDPSISAEQVATIRSLEVAVLGGEPGDIRYPITNELTDRKTTWIYKSKVKTAVRFLVAARGPSRELVASGLSKSLTPGGSAVSDTVQLTGTPPIPNKLRLGESCIDGVDVCASGFCVDSVCCDSVCDGPCNTCVGLVAGKCAPAGTGTSPRKACLVDANAPCGNDGTCDGAGACHVGALGKLCGPQHCDAGMFTSAATCDGMGSCMTPPARDCAPYDCNPSATACATICTGGAVGCSSGNTCNFGNCGPVGQGARCIGSGDCAAGLPCVDGYCCDQPCIGACVGCGVLGHEGTCINVPSGGSDPHQMCPDEGAASCGKNGRCDGKAACQFYAAGTPCAGGGCSDDATSYTEPGACAGDGSACPMNTVTSCAPYLCVTTGLGSGCDQSCGECGFFDPGSAPPFPDRCASGLSCVDQCLGSDQRFVCQ